MKVVGLITEYNPFHNGHIYHIEQTRKIHKPDVLIVIMSGNHVQRGEPAIIDKWTRTKLAIDHGVDLVVELPFVFAIQSADYFGNGAVHLLNQLNVTDIVFGSESGDINKLYTLANGVKENKDQYELLVNAYMQEGIRYVEACNKALSSLLNETVTLPNDLLGYSYVKSVVFNDYPIQLHCIERTNHFHELELKDIASATAIRNALKEHKALTNCMPSIQLYNGNLVFNENYFPYLKYKLQTTNAIDLEKIHLVEEGIENLLLKHIDSCYSMEEFIQKITSKRYTIARIQRMFLHILLNNTKEDIIHASNVDYVRILGMNNTGQEYLNKLKKDITYSLISTYSKYKHIALSIELKSAKLYELIYKNNISKKEYSNKPYIKSKQ